MPMKDLFYLSDEQRMIRDLTRKVARERIAPRSTRAPTRSSA